MGGIEPSIQRHTNIMVKYKTILSVIEQNLNTPTITKHSSFQYNLEGLLRQITDNKEEYKTLKEDIWKFYKETKKSDHEEVSETKRIGDNVQYRRLQTGEST